MFCQKCGNKNADDSMFCRFCGEKLVPVSSNTDSSYQKDTSSPKSYSEENIPDTTVLQMGSKNTDYSGKFISSAGIAAVLIITGLLFAYAYFNNLTKVGNDEPYVLFLAFPFILLGAIFGIRSGGNYCRAKKAKDTQLRIGRVTVTGNVNGISFSVQVKDISSTSVQEYSTMTNEYGCPKSMSVDGSMRFFGLSNIYLSIYMKNGDIYYIDCLESPETAKNTIDSLIVRTN